MHARKADDDTSTFKDQEGQDHNSLSGLKSGEAPAGKPGITQPPHQ